MQVIHHRHIECLENRDEGKVAIERQPDRDQGEISQIGAVTEQWTRSLAVTATLRATFLALRRPTSAPRWRN